MTGVSDDREALAARLDVAEAIVRHEYAQFDKVNSEGGRAFCQDDWPTFHAQRLSQFLTWPVPLLESYAADLDRADERGRNLLTEKYAWMMATTEPERFATEIAPRLPVLTPSRMHTQERIIETQVAWAQAFHAEYPRLGAHMRVLRTHQDTLAATSFETYLRGELSSYSDTTIDLYAGFVADLEKRGVNLTEQTVALTVGLAGYGSLSEAEADQPQ